MGRRPSPAVVKAWAEAVLDLYGPYCIFCGYRDIELDHIHPKSQGGLYVPGNGVPVCSWRSVTIPGGHHKAKTESRLKYPPSLLLPVTIEYLAAANWVAWDQDGEPYGRGCRHFEPLQGSPMMGGVSG